MVVLKNGLQILIWAALEVPFLAHRFSGCFPLVLRIMYCYFSCIYFCFMNKTSAAFSTTSPYNMNHYIHISKFIILNIIGCLSLNRRRSGCLEAGRRRWSLPARTGRRPTPPELRRPPAWRTSGRNPRRNPIKRTSLPPRKPRRPRLAGPRSPHRPIQRIQRI